jgi:hypothetical protein
MSDVDMLGKQDGLSDLVGTHNRIHRLGVKVLRYLCVQKVEAGRVLEETTIRCAFLRNAGLGHEVPVSSNDVVHAQAWIEAGANVSDSEDHSARMWSSSVSCPVCLVQSMLCWFCLHDSPHAYMCLPLIDGHIRGDLSFFPPHYIFFYTLNLTVAYTQFLCVSVSVHVCLCVMCMCVCMPGHVPPEVSLCIMYAHSNLACASPRNVPNVRRARSQIVQCCRSYLLLIGMQFALPAGLY